MQDRYMKGQKWSSLTLVSDMCGGNDFKSTHKSVFVCDCGLTHFATLNNVSRGIVKHCSACSSKKKSGHKKTHGNSIAYKERDPLGYKCYYTWQAMKRRCNNPKDRRYSDYGGRGIGVCEAWNGSYKQFLLDMGLPPSMGHQIDRIDNDKDYMPSNCKWVGRVENASHKRNSNNITAFGRTQILAEWERETGIKRETIAMRIRRGWEPEKALAKKPRKMTISNA